MIVRPGHSRQQCNVYGNLGKPAIASSLHPSHLLRSRNDEVLAKILPGLCTSPDNERSMCRCIPSICLGAVRRVAKWQSVCTITMTHLLQSSTIMFQRPAAFLAVKYSERHLLLLLSFTEQSRQCGSCTNGRETFERLRGQRFSLSLSARTRMDV